MAWGGAGVSNAAGATIGSLDNAAGGTITGGEGGFFAGFSGAGIANSGAIATLTNSGRSAAAPAAPTQAWAARASSMQGARRSGRS